MSNLNEHGDAGLRKWVAGCVVLVLVVFAVAQVAHFDAHVGGGSTSAHCTICAAAHSAAAPSQLPAVAVVFSSAVLVFAQEPQLQSRLAVAALFIRPPPAIL